MLKTIFRVGAIGMVATGVLTGGALLIAGPQRAKAMFHKVHDEVLSEIDRHIDDPTALRAQLEELEHEYPQRIAQVRADLAELNEQIRQLERERDICTRVVEMADADLGELEPRLQETAAVQAANGNVRGAVVQLGDRIYSYERALTKSNQIRQTRVAYSDRAANAAHDLTYLEKQAGQLQELLVQLENERAQFQAQIWQLSRQVDAIARNERLIELLDKRNRTIEECTRYDAVSLDQITGRLSEIRSRQEAELDTLANSRRELEYEDMARMQLRGELQVPADADGASFAGVGAPSALRASGR